MAFENPIFLYGLTASAIPIVLHLIHRRKAKVHSFAAIDFILLSNKRLARKLKIRQFLILLVRILLIAALVLAFAKPYLTVSGEAALFRSSEPSSTVIILDNSFSMETLEDGKMIFSKTKKQIIEMIEEFRPEDGVAIVTASKPAEAMVGHLSRDKRLIAELIENVKPTYRSTDLAGAIRLAETILKDSQLNLKQIVIFTDCTRTSWETMSKPLTISPQPIIKIYNVTEDREFKNVAISGIDIVRAFEISPSHFRIRAKIDNFSSASFNDVVTLKMEHTTVKGVLKLKPGESGSKEFLIKVDTTKSHMGSIEIPEDSLSGDNSFSFFIKPPSMTHVLVVNGSPSSVPFHDETYFLSHALKPGNENVANLSVRFIRPDELGSTPLENIDVVFLCNVPALTKIQVDELNRYVQDGGCLFFTSGENVTLDYNTDMIRLLPFPIVGVKRVVDDGLDGDASLYAQHFSEMDDHEIFNLFKFQNAMSLFNTNIYKYVLLDSKGRPDAKVLLRYSSGAPALAEGFPGKGKVLFLTTSISRQWTDFPIRTSYLPFIQKAISYLASGSKKELPTEIEVGASINIPIEPHLRKVTIEPLNPSVASMELDPSSWQDNDNLKIESLDNPGVYKVQREFEHLSQPMEDFFTVRLNLKESDLKRMSMKEIYSRLTVEQNPKILQETETTNRQRLNQWSHLLLAIILLLLLEEILVMRR